MRIRKVNDHGHPTIPGNYWIETEHGKDVATWDGLIWRYPQEVGDHEVGYAYCPQIVAWIDEIDEPIKTAPPVVKRVASDYSVGDPVLYIPPHANRNPRHPGCQPGYIPSIRDGEDELIWVSVERGGTGACCHVDSIAPRGWADR